MKKRATVSIEQVMEQLTTSKKLGRTLPDMARHFGTTKDRIKRVLGRIQAEWRIVTLSDGTSVYVLRRYKGHEVKRLYRRIAKAA